MLNETGNGTLCIDRFPLPEGVMVMEGQMASLQVVTVGERGSALYNVRYFDCCSLNSPFIFLISRTGEIDIEMSVNTGSHQIVRRYPILLQCLPTTYR